MYKRQALGGVLTWVIYVIANTWGFDVFISSLFASAFAAIYSEVIAKIRKAPTTLFLIISVVVLIPGGSLYYTMSYAAVSYTHLTFTDFTAGILFCLAWH